MAIPLIYTFLFALCGVGVSLFLFYSQRLIHKIWLGLVLGLLMLTWIPSLFAFFIGFTLTAQIIASAVGVFLSGGCIFLALKKGYLGSLKKRFSLRDLDFLLVTVPLFLLGAVLFSSHILQPNSDGSVSVGQVTYGDLAMHLGFISSIAEQGSFPPSYSIFPGHTVNYPFLCETSASSLVVLGANLRQAYLISALYAYLLVIMGIWFFFREWLKTTRRTVLATLLFFLGSGFGFAYFFDLAKHGASLNTLLSGSYSSNFAWLLDGFYDTPTNLPTIGLRWVNPIVDMLIPQRATLFGWAFLFPCLMLLHGYRFHDRRENIIPLGIISGLLPLIHTHSFLALGVISAVYCLTDRKMYQNPKRLFGWLIYAGLACLIGMPQLFGFAFRQASESGMVRLHWNWANEADSYLWFYLKNWGMLFLLLPFSFLILSKRDRKIFIGPLLLWILAEIVVFQPNNYDNNKLIFVVFAYVCGMVSKIFDLAIRRCSRFIRKRSAPEDRTRALLFSSIILDSILLFSFATKLTHSGSIAWYTICTLLFLLGLNLWLVTGSIRFTSSRVSKYLIVLSLLSSLYPMIELLAGLYHSYHQTTLYLNSLLIWITVILFTISILFKAVVLYRLKTSSGSSRGGVVVAARLCAYMLALSLTLSSTMTILRELRSEYQVYNKNDIEVTEFIKDTTPPDSIILANSYLWNLVTPLTGRNIVTGTSTFLYFHGIDNSQRESDVRSMYEVPSECEELFRTYNIRYILISNAERYNYDIDYEFFSSSCKLIFNNPSAQIYQIN